jgi:hypothetical protein
MKIFMGKIGKYKRITQQERSAIYLGFQKYMRKLTRQHIEYGKEHGYGNERNLVDKLKIRKGGKLQKEVYDKEYWQEIPYMPY